MKTFIKRFSESRSGDIVEVGGKNASLGEMLNILTPKGINIPDGFAINISAFRQFLSYNNLEYKLEALTRNIDRKEFSNLEHIGRQARALINGAKFPPQVENAIMAAYNEYFGNSGQEVAVRSSSTTVDTGDADFAGLHDSFVNIKGPLALIYAVKCCFASYYTDRAIRYREEKGYAHSGIYLSVGVQQMVRSDLACSGIGYTLNPDTGFNGMAYLAGTWGLGNYIVQDVVTPDEFLVFKPALSQGNEAIILKNMGSKSRMLIYNENAAGTNSTVDKITPRELRTQFVLSDKEIEMLSRWLVIIEEQYGKPMKFEWAKDGMSQQFYIIQAVPNSVHLSQKSAVVSKLYTGQLKSTAWQGGL